MTEHICTCGHKSFGHENGTDECLAIGCGCEKAVEQISTPTDQHERETLANLIPLDLVHDRGREGFPQDAFEAADRILAAGFHRHPQPTEGEPSDAGIEEASRIMYEDEREWYGTAKWPHWDDADEMTKREMRRAMRAALRAARVADQGRTEPMSDNELVSRVTAKLERIPDSDAVTLDKSDVRALLVLADQGKPLPPNPLPESGGQRQITDDRIEAAMTVCPECAQGKCRNCTGWVLDEDDREQPCPCAHAA